MRIEEQAEHQADIIARRFYGGDKPGQPGLIEQYADADTMQRHKRVLHKSVKYAILKIAKRRNKHH